MKKLLTMTSIISITLLLLAGCGGEDKQQGKGSAETNVPWLISLEVYSNAVNPENIYHAAYPYGYYAFTSDKNGGMGTERFDLADHIKNDELAQEEYDAFLESFFDKSGFQVEEVDSDQDYLRYFYLPDTGKYFYKAQTNDLDNLPTVKGSYDYYFLELDAHMEGMSNGVDFIYSADCKYILVPMDCGTDITLAFCE